jgi:alpha-L-rhamnosidase
LLLLELFVLMQSVTFAKEPAPIEIVQLKTHHMLNPLGIGTSTPRFSWLIKGEQRGVVQEAYQILVASSPEKLAAGEGDLGNSGKIVGSQSIQILYSGTSLKSKTFACRKVKV